LIGSDIEAKSIVFTGQNFIESKILENLEKSENNEFLNRIPPTL